MKYILNDAGEPEPCEDALQWATWFENTENRVVAQTKVGKLEVSTVFLGLDHSFGSGPPLLWETMVFGDDEDRQQRYTSAEDARAGHDMLVAELRRADHA